jgi:hypothetical protein
VRNYLATFEWTIHTDPMPPPALEGRYGLRVSVETIDVGPMIRIHYKTPASDGWLPGLVPLHLPPTPAAWLGGRLRDASAIITDHDR